MKKVLLVSIVIGLPFLVTGCASVTGTPNQSVSVQTREQSGIEIAGASCELSNDEGKWFVTTPGSVTIHRSNKDLQVSCKKEDLQPGRATVVSDTKGSMFGNIILGGGVGAIIDHNSGSAYEYPTMIDILMGGYMKITSKSRTNLQATSAPEQKTATTHPDTQKLQVVAAQTHAESAQNTPVHSSEDKLIELKKLHDSGLISDEVYAERQKTILSR